MEKNKRDSKGRFPKLTIETLQRIAKEKGGNLISKEYVNIHFKYKWECQKGHQWEAMGYSIRNGTWCPQCAHENRLPCSEETKTKIRDTQKGKPRPYAVGNKGNKGGTSWNKGIPMREESRLKMIASKTKFTQEERKENRKKSCVKYFTKKKNNSQFRINATMSGSIYNSLSGKKNYRKWMDLAGYTVEDLMAHLEKRFSDGMNWENYGHGKDKWNIDHIIPKSLWVYNSPEDREFQQCWAMVNLQPMWMSENCRKGNRIQSVETLHGAP